MVMEVGVALSKTNTSAEHIQGTSYRKPLHFLQSVVTAQGAEFFRSAHREE